MAVESEKKLSTAILFCVIRRRNTVQGITQEFIPKDTKKHLNGRMTRSQRCFRVEIWELFIEKSQYATCSEMEQVHSITIQKSGGKPPAMTQTASDE